jgi:hypothetical protein
MYLLARQIVYLLARQIVYLLLDKLCVYWLDKLCIYWLDKLCIYWLHKLLFQERNALLYVTFLILRLVNTTDSCSCGGASDGNDGTTPERRTGNDVNGRTEQSDDSCQSYFVISYFTSQGLLILMFISEIWNS